MSGSFIATKMKSFLNRILSEQYIVGMYCMVSSQYLCTTSTDNKQVVPLYGTYFTYIVYTVPVATVVEFPAPGPLYNRGFYGQCIFLKPLRPMA